MARVVTQKAVNSRMGKGKGGRIGTVAQICSGTLIFGTTVLRRGLLKKLAARLRVRCNFPIFLGGLGLSDRLTAQPSWVRFQCLHLNYVSARLADLREQLLSLRRPVLWVYTSRLFF